MAGNANSKSTKVSSFPRDVLEQAIIVKRGWSKLGEKLLVPNITIDKFLKKLIETQDCVDNAEQLKIERAKAVYERNEYLNELWDLVKRIRNAAKATFGDYS